MSQYFYSTVDHEQQQKLNNRWNSYKITQKKFTKYWQQNRGVARNSKGKSFKNVKHYTLSIHSACSHGKLSQYDSSVGTLEGLYRFSSFSCLVCHVMDPLATVGSCSLSALSSIPHIVRLFVLPSTQSFIVYDGGWWQ